MKGLLLPLLAGYLLGSFLPAYFLARFLAGKDIRLLGDGNPGTTNVSRTLGFLPAFLTASYDATKGLAAMALAACIFSASLPVVYLSGAAAIYGHVFPFYLGFRGGRGAATATGMLIFLLAKEAAPALSLPAFWADLAYLGFFVLALYFACGNENFLALSVLPVLTALLFFRLPWSMELVFLVFLAAHIFTVSLLNARKLGIFATAGLDLKRWRVFIRPAAMSFPFLYFLLGRRPLLALVGTVLLLSFVLDLLRLSLGEAGGFERLYEKVYKQGERGRVSSITLFLLGVFLSFLLFRPEVAVASVSFLIFGDMMAKVVGISYGKRLLFAEHKKTLEGFLGFLAAAVSVAHFMWLAGAVSLGAGLAGAVVAAAAESLPLAVNDNLSVPVLSGAVMSLF